MAGSARNDPHVIEWLRQLESEPHRFGFLSALRKLESIYEEKPRLGESVRSSDDAVRLGQDPSLIFAPRPIASFKVGTRNTPDRLETFFFGLFGPNGPMPLHISEFVHARELNEGDRTFRGFADMFHHRLASLFYRASANAEPTINMDRPEENRFDLYVGALLGIGPEAFRGRDAMPDRAKLHNTALLSLQTRPALAFVDLLENYFGLPFAVSELVGEWMTLAAEDRAKLGVADGACVLGESAILGDEIWGCQHRFRVVCGPLSLAEFERLLPGESGVNSLFAAVRNYAGDEFAWDMQLVLRKDDVPGTTLGHDGRLGWTTWMGARNSDADADDVIIDLQTMVANQEQVTRAQA
jgi:type VI secretion system protein ImpH